MTACIDANRDRFGVEPICRVLQFAPPTYWSVKRRAPSARSVRYAELKVEIARVHAENFEVYGAPKVWAQPQPRGTSRGSLHRGAADARPGPSRRHPRQAQAHHRRHHSRAASDLVERRFSAPAPNRLQVADITYMRTWSGFVYVANAGDAQSRRIVGWQASRSLRSDLALHALEQAIFERDRTGDSLDGLIHHSDRGTQYLSIRYSERLAANDIAASVGSRGDSYDNALAETTIGLYKAELVRHRGPWRGLEDLELATLEWVHWLNNGRIHHHNPGRIPPAEAEEPQQHSARHSETQTKQPA